MNSQIQNQTQTQTHTQMSLYIPHVFPNFDEQYIANVMKEMNYGIVDHVDLVSKIDKNGKRYNSAYVHFASWFSGTIVENFQAKVRDPNAEARIVHDDPWYWIVLENTAKKHEPGARKTRIDLMTSNIEVETNVELSEVKLCNQPMDMSFTYVEDEHLTENDQLRSNITRHYEHANECHKKIAELQQRIREMEEENDELNQDLIEQRLTFEAESNQLEEVIHIVMNSKSLDELKSEISTLFEV